MLKSISTGLIVLSFIVISTVFFPCQAVIAAPTDNPQCEGLTGAAFGLCAAATAVGCDGSETQAPGCENIAEQFTQITGVSPPWTLPACPCGTTNDFISYLDPRGGGSECIDKGTVIYINSPVQTFDVFADFPGELIKNGSCGFAGGAIKYQTTLDETESCALNVKSAASHYNLSCGTVGK